MGNNLIYKPFVQTLEKERTFCQLPSASTKPKSLWIVSKRENHQGVTKGPFLGRSWNVDWFNRLDDVRFVDGAIYPYETTDAIYRYGRRTHLYNADLYSSVLNVLLYSGDPYSSVIKVLLYSAKHYCSVLKVILCSADRYSSVLNHSSV